MSRDKDTPATLNELMGKKAETVSLESLPDILGLNMPEIEMTNVGKIRLMRSLKKRFGEGFRNIPGVKGMLSNFEKEIKLNNIIKMNKEKRS